MYVRNQSVVPELVWYLRIRIGCGTGSKPTNVPCCKNLRISFSSVMPLSMHIFSTCGTSTCSMRIMVCNGSFCFHDTTHSGVACHGADRFEIDEEVLDWRLRLRPASAGSLCSVPGFG